jgi:hypothetical protein
VEEKVLVGNGKEKRSRAILSLGKAVKTKAISTTEFEISRENNLLYLSVSMTGNGMTSPMVVFGRRRSPLLSS